MTDDGGIRPPEKKDMKKYAEQVFKAIGELEKQAEHFARKSFKIMTLLSDASGDQSSIAFRPFWDDYQAKVAKMVEALADVSPLQIERKNGIRYSLQSGFIVGWIQEIEGQIHTGLYLEICPHSIIV